MKRQYDIAAYVWPSYTGDEPRSKIFWQEGYGEWQTVKKAVPKFDGHNWPRRPLWGYVNEADPAVMEMEINAAADHGVNVFIYDWYWFDRRPFLECCLNDGFLGAKNNDRMKFYLMWANHNANHLWSYDLSDTEVGETVIWKGGINRIDFEEMCERIIDKYFFLPNYYTIDGCPVFMIYELSTFVEGMGSAEEAAAALEWLKRRVKEKGLPGVHLQITGRSGSTLNLSGVDGGAVIDSAEVMKLLGIDSFSHYQFVHFTDIDRDYGEIMEDVKRVWDCAEKDYGIPYYAHVSCGWDNNPRFKKFRPGIVKNNTPEAFERALVAAKEYTDKMLEKHPERPALITVNSWNEWTETSYLEPDDLYGYGYLEAIKKVFTE
ncbi:MAG: glycoside hydrolase family 99-like domain-containing protein [Clostridia bacterium]|nr:glycoside hydrolase family 99-like domain-containing protein [Clostridia bacterium]MBR3681228.1 glycoside hydrolase family 99-like domain-containing protein [Clostridia bacterium]